MKKARKKKEVVLEKGNQVLMGRGTDMFSVSSYTLNRYNDVVFPGNIAPEGYFYSPFYEVTLKEDEEELQYVNVRRINFVPSAASVTSGEVMTYDPVTKEETEKEMWFVSIISPITYNIIYRQPFSIYDIELEKTYRGYLDSISGTEITLITEAHIDSSGLTGVKKGLSGKSQYIISILEENAPEYAEFIPSSQRLVWRGQKKISQLTSTSPLYDMPFTNGRNYIHKNINVFVRRQDPDGDFKLFRPWEENPLRRFQIEGDKKIDFDQVLDIIDSMIDAC